MSSFTPLANTTAKVLKYLYTNGKGTGSTSTVIEALKITPPVTIDYNTAQRVGTTHRPVLQSPHKFRMVLFEGNQDVVQGDVMEIGGTQFPIRHVEEWPYIRLGQTRMVAILEYEVRDR